jgi:putative AlgH/UPF0301 family transcriptional regulator
MPVSTTITHSGACLRDHFLLAMPSLEEGLFAHSVTYLCEHGESGAMGLVVNQPLDLNVAEIFEHLKIEACRDFSDEPVMAGGPVQLDHGFVLHRGARQNWDASLTVTEDITLTTSRDILVGTTLSPWATPAGQPASWRKSCRTTAGSPRPPTAISCSRHPGIGGCPRPPVRWA